MYLQLHSFNDHLLYLFQMFDLLYKYNAFSIKGELN